MLAARCTRRAFFAPRCRMVPPAGLGCCAVPPARRAGAAAPPPHAPPPGRPAATSARAGLFWRFLPAPGAAPAARSVPHHEYELVHDGVVLRQARYHHLLAGRVLQQLVPGSRKPRRGCWVVGAGLWVRVAAHWVGAGATLRTGMVHASCCIMQSPLPAPPQPAAPPAALPAARQQSHPSNPRASLHGQINGPGLLLRLPSAARLDGVQGGAQALHRLHACRRRQPVVGGWRSARVVDCIACDAWEGGGLVNTPPPDPWRPRPGCRPHRRTMCAPSVSAPRTRVPEFPLPHVAQKRGHPFAVAAHTQRVVCRRGACDVPDTGPSAPQARPRHAPAQGPTRQR